MSHSVGKKRLKMDGPATYRIHVQGCLDDVWSDRLANMTITMDLSNEHSPVSTLTGKIRDQAELVGVINGLYELRMPLLAMEITNGES